MASQEDIKEVPGEASIPEPAVIEWDSTKPDESHPSTRSRVLLQNSELAKGLDKLPNNATSAKRLTAEAVPSELINAIDLPIHYSGTLIKLRWVSKETERLIREACGDLSNPVCNVCHQKLSCHARLKVHAPQHFVNYFCPCGQHSYVRDYVTRHQKLETCHVGEICVVDKENFAGFWEAIKGHITQEKFKVKLSEGFPICRRTTPKTKLKAQKYRLKPVSVRLETLPSYTAAVANLKTPSSSLGIRGRRRRNHVANRLRCLKPQYKHMPKERHHEISQEHVPMQSSQLVGFDHQGGSGYKVGVAPMGNGDESHQAAHLLPTPSIVNNIGSIEQKPFSQLKRIEDQMASIAKTLRSFRSMVELMEDQFQIVQTELRNYRDGLSNFN